jgi:Bifunctional DNA primase/polymerase, N-terminal
MTWQEVLALRVALRELGYLPIPLFGKEPPIYGKNNKHKGLSGWQLLDNVTPEQIEMWSKSWPDANNTGILTRVTPALDLDILYEDAAETAETFVRERFEERGYFLVRIGLPPKRAILFRTLTPFDKITIEFIQTRSKLERIEFLCNGQQLVCNGTHPETGKPYGWFGGEPWQISHDDLPYISAEEAQQLAADLAEMLRCDFGYKLDPKAAKKKAARTASNGAPPVNASYVVIALEQECAAVVNARPGMRNDQINKSAFNLGQLIEEGLLDESMVRERLYAAAIACGYVKDDGEEAAINTINSGLVGGKARPRFGTVQPQPQPTPSPPPPPPPPPPPQSPPVSRQPSAPQPSGPQPALSPVEETLQAFREWLLLDSDIPVLGMLGSVAGNLLPGDAIWYGIIAPASSGKTEMLITLINIPHTELVGTLSVAGLLSGTPRRQRAAGARGGLLQKIGAHGFLVLKDFGSILSLRPDTKMELLAALREIYDGKWTRVIGADGGKVLTWSGKVGLLFGCTRAFDNYYGVISELGDRFLLCRMEPNKNQFIHAIRHANRAAQMRSQLVDAVTKLFAAPLPAPRDISDREVKWLNEILQVAVRLRGGVKRDYRTRELEDIYGAEGTGRFGKALERVLSGLDCLGVKRNKARRVIRTIAFDSVPPNRLNAFRHLKSLGNAYADTTAVAKAIKLPTITARRALEELVIYGLAERDSQGPGKADLWRTV